MRVGFSGTRKGLTNAQLVNVHMLLGDLQDAGASQASHGMCLGADAEFHDQAKGFGYFVVGAPGVGYDWLPHDRAQMTCDLMMPPRPFLVRNRMIVHESDVMIVCPKETTEQHRGSGTWATLRYTRSVQKPLVILWPDGSSVVEGVTGVRTAEQYRDQLAVGRK